MCARVCNIFCPCRSWNMSPRILPVGSGWRARRLELLVLLLLLLLLSYVETQGYFNDSHWSRVTVLEVVLAWPTLCVTERLWYWVIYIFLQFKTILNNFLLLFISVFPIQAWGSRDVGQRLLGYWPRAQCAILLARGVLLLSAPLYHSNVGLPLPR